VSTALFASSTTCVLAFLAALAVADIGTHRIPNVLTVSAASLGVLLNLRNAGSHGALLSVAGALTGLAIFLPFYLAKGFGAGDVKAMGAVGAFVGPHGAMLAGAGTLIAGAICALILLIVRREHSALAALPRRWAWQVFTVYSTGRPASALVTAADDATRRRFPYGLAIACGTAFSLLWSTP
jgi:prepilin peptidase CpaA